MIACRININNGLAFRNEVPGIRGSDADFSFREQRQTARETRGIEMTRRNLHKHADICVLIFLQAGAGCAGFNQGYPGSGAHNHIPAAFRWLQRDLIS